VAVEAAEAAFPVDAVPGLEHALFRQVVGLSATIPLLVCVDDLHWGDEASLRWNADLARRVGRLPVVVLAARRVGQSSCGPRCWRSSPSLKAPAASCRRP
jgi:hypothetical protein